MQLRDEGRFGLDDEVASLLPWFRIGTPDFTAPALTVEGLLTHSSGIPNDLAGRSDMPPSYPTLEEIRAGIPELELHYPAWQHEHYSNLGLVLVGEIISELSGMPYGEYVTERILRPLGMSSTTPEISEMHGTERLATGYSAPRRGGGRRAVLPFEARGMAAALGFASTVEDLARFAAWQFRALDTGDHEILAANTLREMYRTRYMDPETQAEWGLGFTVIRDGAERFVGHAGFCPGFQSNLVLHVEDTIAASNAMVPAWRYTSAAYELLAPAIKAAKDDPGGETTLPPELEKFVGTYDSFPWGSERQVIPWDGGLAVVSFPGDSPRTGMRRLRHLEGNSFEADDNWRTVEYVFDQDGAGEVVALVLEGTPFPRIP